MECLYSIHSPNGMGYQHRECLELDKKTPDYYQYYVTNDDENNQWHEYILETKPGICCQCNKNMKTPQKDKDYQLLYPEESMFIFTSKRGDEYWYIYYHYCSNCLEKGLYNWSKSNNRKYPILRYDGGYFINSLKNMDEIKIPESITFPRIYRCNYYLSNGYRYLDEDKTEYTQQEIEMSDKLDKMDKIDRMIQ